MSGAGQLGVVGTYLGVEEKAKMSDKEEEAEAKEAPRMFDALHAIELQDMGGRPLPLATAIACCSCCCSALSLCSALLQGRGLERGRRLCRGR